MRAHELIEDRMYGDQPRRTIPLDLDSAIRLIKENCSDALKEERIGNRIYRGINLDADAAYFDPSSARPRRSRNTDNFVTLIMDNSPPWQAYPKRSRSMICTGALNKARAYGHVYMVLPYNGVKIGIAPKYDIWDGFDDSTGMEVPDINIHLQTMVSDIIGEELSQTDWEEFCGQLQATGEIVCDWVAEQKARNSQPTGKEKNSQTLDDYRQHIDWNHLPKYGWELLGKLTKSGTDPDLLGNLFQMLSPNWNNFRLTTAGAVGLKSTVHVLGGKEMWLEGPAILLHEQHWDEALKFNEIQV